GISGEHTLVKPAGDGLGMGGHGRGGGLDGGDRFGAEHGTTSCEVANNWMDMPNLSTRNRMSLSIFSVLPRKAAETSGWVTRQDRFTPVPRGRPRAGERPLGSPRPGWLGVRRRAVFGTCGGSIRPRGARVVRNSGCRCRPAEEG